MQCSVKADRPAKSNSGKYRQKTISVTRPNMGKCRSSQLRMVGMALQSQRGSSSTVALAAGDEKPGAGRRKKASVPLPSPVALAYRVNDAAKVAGLNRSSLYELMAARKLRSVMVAGRRLIPGRPINSEQRSETADGVARESEGRTRLPLLRPLRQDQPRGHSGARLCPVPLQQGRAGRGSSELRGHRGVRGSDGWANWRLRSGRRLTDRIQSDACTYRRPTANSGRWASQPCGIGSA